MKVLHLVGTLNSGGIERVVSQLALAQKNELGLTPMIACVLKKEGAYLTSVTSSDIPVFDCGYPKTKPWELSRQISGIIKHYHPDIIHSHINFSLIWQAIPKNYYSIPFVLTQHSISTYASNFFYKLRAFLGYRMIKQGQFSHTAVSDFAAQYAAKLFSSPQEKIPVIQNGIRNENYVFDEIKRIKYRRIWGIRNDEIVVGCVGRLDYVKGYDILLKAFARVAEQKPETRLLLVGDGDLRNQLVDLSRQLNMEEKVIWAGKVEDIQGALSAFDIYVQASRWETLSLSILEALANNLHVIATSTGGAKEIANYFKDIDLCPIDSVEDLATLASERIRSLQSRKLVYKEYPHVFQFSNMLSHYMDIYEALLSKE